MPDDPWILPAYLTWPAEGEAHIWQVSLDQPEVLVEQWYTLLSADERERADRYYFERDRRRFVVARASLRRLLSVYVQQPPHLLTFSYSNKGKPFLARQPLPQDGRLCFNLAHSSELAVYAIMVEHEPGIDLELIRPMDDALSIAWHYFSPQEYAILSTLSDERMYETFFTYWTRKEACLKACGKGIELLTTQLDVARSANNAVRLQGENGPLQWYVQDLHVAPGYKAALAVDIPDVTVTYK